MGTITASFFSAYELGGVAHLAIDVVRELHVLGVRPRLEPLQGKWKQVYTETLPKQVKEQTDAFDFSQITGGRISPIISEIGGELKRLDGDERERYLYSLLIPFRELAGILNPVTSDDKDCILIKPTSERRAEINRRFCEVLDNANIGTIEYYCSVWVEAALQFANRLDALLLTYGIDLLQLQEKSGIYLKSYREITDVEYYIGGYELARRYINVLKPRSEQTSDAQSLNPEPKLAAPEPQQEQPKPTRGKGRPKKTLKDKMIDDANGQKLQKMHTKLDGKNGKDAALIILACIKKGWLTKPTYTQVKNEFGDIGSKTGYNNYLNANKFTREELEGAINSLD